MPSKDEVKPISSKILVTTTTAGCGIFDQSYSTQDESFEFKYKKKSWSHTPNYTALVRSHQRLPDNAFDFHLLEMDTSSRLITTSVSRGVENPLSCEPTVTQTRSRLAAYLPEDAGGSDPSFTDIFYDVLKKAKSNQVNLPTFFAEGRKTADMVVGTATKIVNMLRNLRRGNVRYFLDNLHVTKALSEGTKIKAVRRFNKDFGKDAINTASNTWLEYSYGWKPFLKDVHDAVMTFADLAEKPDRTVMRVRKGSSVTTRSITEFLREVSPLDIYMTRQRTVRIDRRVTWLCGVNPSDVPARVGLVNPTEVAWELVPFSFVVDWFLPIGDYLSAFDVPMRFNHFGGTYGFRRTTVDTCYGARTPSPPFPNPRLTITLSGSFSNSYVHVNRKPLTGPPVPAISEIVLKGDLGSNRLASGFALMRQQFNRMRR